MLDRKFEGTGLGSSLKLSKEFGLRREGLKFFRKRLYVFRWVEQAVHPVTDNLSCAARAARNDDQARR